MGDRFRLEAGEFLVVGLGNPGPEYVGSRHNFGFMLVDRLLNAGDPSAAFKLCAGGLAAVARLRPGGRPVCLVKPLAYMNRSGLVLARLLETVPELDPEKLLVVHDDLDLALGRIKLKCGGGSGGHRGVASVIAELGRTDFLRLRLGIDSEQRGLDTVDFVLSRFAEPELELVVSVLERGVKGLLRYFAAGNAAAMNELNRAPREVLQSNDSDAVKPAAELPDAG